MTLVSALLFSSLVLGSAPSAQTVSPAHFTNAAGNMPTFPISGPFLAAGARYLQIHGDLSGPLTIQAIAFRAFAFGGPMAVSGPASIRVWMSHGVTPANLPDAVLDNNHGADKTLVLPQTAVTIPASTVEGDFPRAFDYVLQLATPFAYNGTSPLVWEIEALMAGPVQPAVAFDGFQSPNANPVLTNALRGAGCFATGRTDPMLSGAIASGNWPSGNGNLSLVLGDGPSNANGALFFGLDFLGVVIPGTSVGASGPCFLHTTPFVDLPLFFGASGGIPIPFDIGLGLSSDLHGITLFVQTVALDPTANSLGLVSSNAASTHFVEPYPSIPVSSVLGVVGLPNGTRMPNVGTVVEFR